jgi:hypothetical protein
MEKNGEIKQKGHLYQMGHNPFRSFYAGIVDFMEANISQTLMLHISVARN